MGARSDLKLEVVVIPVSDPDRAKAFYAGLGWRLDADLSFDNGVRIIQFTPPGSPCSIQFGPGLTQAPPGSAHALYLVVSDIEAARADLTSRGVDVSDVQDTSPPDTSADSYFLYASFKDPDGNGFLLQQITSRLPGREWED